MYLMMEIVPYIYYYISTTNEMYSMIYILLSIIIIIIYFQICTIYSRHEKLSGHVVPINSG
jgi:hypothetical protein